jgi:hypothetical protein
MALTPTQRKRGERARNRERDQALGMKPMLMDLAASERAAIETGAQAGGYKDQTEYILSLVYADRDKSRKCGSVKNDTNLTPEQSADAIRRQQSEEAE